MVGGHLPIRTMGNLSRTCKKLHGDLHDELYRRDLLSRSRKAFIFGAANGQVDVMKASLAAAPTLNPDQHFLFDVNEFRRGQVIRSCLLSRRLNTSLPWYQPQETLGTALHFAVINDNGEATEWLLQNGADPLLPSRHCCPCATSNTARRWLALHLAICHNSPRALQIILKDPRVVASSFDQYRGQAGRQPPFSLLHTAASRGLRPVILDPILSALTGPDPSFYTIRATVSAPNQHGETPLDLACLALGRHNHSSTIEWLLDNHAYDAHKGTMTMGYDGERRALVVRTMDAGNLANALALLQHDSDAVILHGSVSPSWRVSRLMELFVSKHAGRKQVEFKTDRIDPVFEQIMYALDVRVGSSGPLAPDHINRHGPDRHTPLTLACSLTIGEDDQAEPARGLVKVLLRDMGADVNAQAGRGMTPLHHAIQTAVRYLERHFELDDFHCDDSGKADPHAAMEDEEIGRYLPVIQSLFTVPLHEAETLFDTGVVRVDVQDSWGGKPLHPLLSVLEKYECDPFGAAPASSLPAAPVVSPDDDDDNDEEDGGWDIEHDHAGPSNPRTRRRKARRQVASRKKAMNGHRAVHYYILAVVLRLAAPGSAGPREVEDYLVERLKRVRRCLGLDGQGHFSAFGRDHEDFWYEYRDRDQASREAVARPCIHRR